MQSLAKRVSVGISYSILYALLIIGCASNSPTGPGNTLSSGPVSTILDRSVGIGGDNIVYDVPNDSLRGLSISVPAGAFKTPINLRIGVSKILSHSFRSDVKVLSPLLTFSGPTGTAQYPLRITIPIKNPTNDCVVPFLYDERSHSLEALSVVSADSTSLSFIMMNFNNNQTASLRPFADEPQSQVVVLSTSAALLTETFDSGFKMDEDNCQFVNYGSEIAIKGHCGGQTIAAAWYYEKMKKNGSPDLFGLYDNDGIHRTPKMWNDDQALYRFCSLVQNHSSWHGIKYWGDNSSDRDERTYKSIAFAIRETGNPQPLYVYDGDNIAHAILAIRTSNGIITIADPNYLEETSITLDKRLGDFVPYNLSRYVGDTKYNCMNIYHACLSQITDLQYCAQQWNNVLNGSCGNAEYSKVRIKLLNTDGDYEDATSAKTIKVYQHTTVDLSTGTFQPSYMVYDRETQSLMDREGRDLNLPLGKHTIGICTYVENQTFPFSGYIGFQWVDLEVVPEDGPMSGPIVLSVFINGVSCPVKDAGFEMNGDATHGYLLFISGTVRTPVGIDEQFTVMGGTLSGGTYSGPPSPLSGIVYRENASQLGTLYRAGNNSDGTINVVAWHPGALDGSFDFKATKDGDATKSLQLRGSFHLP